MNRMVRIKHKASIDFHMLIITHHDLRGCQCFPDPFHIHFCSSPFVRTSSAGDRRARSYRSDIRLRCWRTVERRMAAVCSIVGSSSILEYLSLYRSPPDDNSTSRSLRPSRMQNYCCCCAGDCWCLMNF